MGQKRHATSCFVIPTRHRPDYLLRTVQNVVNQTILPREICIVDSSNETPASGEIEALCADAGVKIDYHHPAPRGVAIQRNIGIERSAGDPVFLIDDDIWSPPDTHQQVLREYERSGPELGGVCPSTPSGDRFRWPAHLYHRFFDVVFGIGGWWPDAPSKVTRAFFVGGPTESTEVRLVACFKGHYMSFRRAVFEHERFDEAMPGYAWKGDFDFTYRASRRHRLVLIPNATCVHLRSDASRLSAHDLNRMKVADQIYLHRKLMPQTVPNKIALWWALIGLVLYHLPVSIAKRDPGYATGLITGLWEQVRGKGLIDPGKIGETDPTASSDSHSAM